MCDIARWGCRSAAGFDVCVRMCVCRVARWGCRSAAGFDVCVRMCVCHIARWGFRSAAGFDVRRATLSSPPSLEYLLDWTSLHRFRALKAVVLEIHC